MHGQNVIICRFINPSGTQKQCIFVSVLGIKKQD